MSYQFLVLELVAYSGSEGKQRVQLCRVREYRDFGAVDSYAKTSDVVACCRRRLEYMRQ